MQSARVLHEPHTPKHGFPQPSPLSLDDSFTSYTGHPPLPFDLQSPATAFGGVGVGDLFPPLSASSLDSVNFFSTNEQDDMLDFLRDFDAADPWEFNPILPSSMPVYPGDIHPGDIPLPPNDQHQLQHQHQLQQYHSDRNGILDSPSTGTMVPEPQSRTTPQGPRSSPRPPSSSSGGTSQQPQSSPNASTSASISQAQDYRPKPLLSGPQKRMNHVKSEKRRRDTIRDGYLTLTKLLSPSSPGAEQLAIPRRGRPKGSGRTGTGKKTGKGKSGVLFRAVEYIRFMEDGCAALERECERLERLVLSAGTIHPQSISTIPYGHSW